MYNLFRAVYWMNNQVVVAFRFNSIDEERAKVVAKSLGEMYINGQYARFTVESM